MRTNEFGAKVKAVWAWKNELTKMYPDYVYYGKILGGHAALMTMQYLRETHYAVARKPISDCSELAQQVYEMIRLNPNVTDEFRRESVELYGCTKSRFDTALKQLQVTLNIVRSNTWFENSDTCPNCRRNV